MLFFLWLGLRKWSCALSRKQALLGVGKLCLGSDEKPGKRERSDERHVLVGFGVTLLEMYPETWIKHLNFSK